ncbi:hypothetical protein M413DRAFT_445001 [Hebeloma cylindrosporum]|uniref:Uncharacterized protein n=1 Tax=Hebeloma cylindrosporum TaxID=76867 RepID=A0A0C3BYU4_HEBCY|nr:hypothetical protein M413DRAFT_445001 [Hebeloma cylindrosporum h7]
MTSSDRGYTILLTHLHNTSSKLPLATIQGALSHHLATASPLPTPLAAAAISSPFYLSQPFTFDKLQSFSTAFRHATHLKYQALVDAEKSRSKLSALLGSSLQTMAGQWVSDVLKGVHGGHPVLRLASCSGLLLGVEDLRIGESGEKGEGIDVGNARSGVENETVVALAEVMDTYAYAAGTVPPGVEEWEKEFQPAGQDILSLVLILASQSLPLVEEKKRKALPLPILARLLTATISSTFKSGTFLSSISASVTLSPQHQVHISPSTPLVQTLQSMSSSPLTISIASISKLTANVLELLIDSPSSSRLNEGMDTISETLDVLRELAKQVERDWIACPLASCTDRDIAQDSKETTKSMWTVLKTLLFSNVMLAEAVLSASVYLRPGSSRITPASLALQTLHILSHLSFIISEFGGVTTTTQGFEHLKKTFYLALDILAHGDGEQGMKAEAYVQQSCFALNSQRAESAATAPRQAKQAFVLASIEQLVPVLSDKCIRDWVWGVCYPHLSDPTHRQTYESAHSVILAIFASHAQRQQQQFTGSQPSDTSPLTTTPRAKNFGSETDIIEREPATNEESNIAATFVKYMVPFYAKCLIDNSVDGKLNTPQLRLAYAALVRSAGASSLASSGAPDEMYTLAWYCVQLLLDTINELSLSQPQNSKGKGKANNRVENDDGAKTADRVHRLHLMLISTISSLPIPLMLRALEETRRLITAYPVDHVGGAGTGAAVDSEEVGENGGKAELLEALFNELLEKTGDREKEAAMRWWYKYRPELISEKVPSKGEQEVGNGGLFSWFKNRRAGAGQERREQKEVVEETLPNLTLSRL